MNIYEICGYLAGILFASSLIPQVYKSFTTKNLDDISLLWQVIFIIATILGIIYGYHFDLKPIYICSLIELILMTILLILKIISLNNNNKIDNDLP